MNSCILMADIVQAPQLRYTSDNQTPVAEFIVQFPGLRDDDPPSQMKVIGWGNLAQEIQEQYREGERVLLEGRLGMNTIERPEGFKEKRAEMTVQRIYSLGQLNTLTMAAEPPEAVAAAAAGQIPSHSPPTPATKATPAAASTPEAEPDYDDIPF
ncbi:single-stranded DNA-binding protein [filamentous cyanobacterium CCP5]|nr:single-stranded DNA-binding protein [filamentous cyanobacterium CCP5]